ncbi:MAG: NAD(P)/FAD-dependent oxidoreductase [Patescibacteria group bacterium]|nr:NAD(P)/FAD-dependent oxidoreductase [Patescibacteria group bacterium]
MTEYDVVIVGASFSGLSLALHLPRQLRVLVLETKPSVGSSVESTGLVTEKTRQEFLQFFDIDSYITNPIKRICVVAPDFKTSFESMTEEPWIYQTDTRGLVQAMAQKLSENVVLKTGAFVLATEKDGEDYSVRFKEGDDQMQARCRFLVGADGGRSRVAESLGLGRNKKFLFGYEKVIKGKILLGGKPDETIYHYWFGDFSLGYGGWMSPTKMLDGDFIRIGLAKKSQDMAEAVSLLDKFVQRLIDLGHIEVNGTRADYAFGGFIPIGGIVDKPSCDSALLIGDAAGMCGAFAADGIKGSLVSAKVAAGLIKDYLEGKKTVLDDYHRTIEKKSGLIGYYRRQLRYRMLWNVMKRNDTFFAMYRIIEAEKDGFLGQFCDSKDKRKSLVFVVLKLKHLPALMGYSFLLLRDFLFR